RQLYSHRRHHSRKNTLKRTDTSMTKPVNFETIFYQSVADGVVLLTLNRPNFGNGVVPQMAKDLAMALSQIEDDNRNRVLILTGAGKQFCAGADLYAFKDYLENE